MGTIFMARLGRMLGLIFSLACGVYAAGFVFAEAHFRWDLSRHSSYWSWLWDSDASSTLRALAWPATLPGAFSRGGTGAMAAPADSKTEALKAALLKEVDAWRRENARPPKSCPDRHPGEVCSAQFDLELREPLTLVKYIRLLDDYSDSQLEAYAESFQGVTEREHLCKPEIIRLMTEFGYRVETRVFSKDDRPIYRYTVDAADCAAHPP